MDHHYLPSHAAPRGRGLPTHDATMAADLGHLDWLYRHAPVRTRPSSGVATVTMVRMEQPAPPAQPRHRKPGRKPRRRPWLLIPAGIVLLGLAAWLGLGRPEPHAPFAPQGGTPSVSAPVSATPSQSPVHVVRTAYRVIFRVTGSGQVTNISYGSEGQLIERPDITAAPFTASLPIWSPKVQAYTITAQQYGADGYIQATITIRQIDHLSDGTRRVKNTTVAVGNANTDGDYATARYAK